MNPGRPFQSRAFTVLELLLSVALTTLIVFALYSMFNQTQRALKSNITQVDVMEAGRAATELMTRELEQMAPCFLPGGTNLVVNVIPLTKPIVQTLPAGTNRLEELRTNVLQEIFFLTRSNNYWVGIGYRVMNATHGAGALHRFAVATNQAWLNRSNLYHAVMDAYATNFVRVADGVIHLRVTAYDAAGRLMRHDQVLPVVDPNVIIRADAINREETQLMFQDYALPAYLELELGVLSPFTMEQFRSIPNTNNARAYLVDQSGSVSLFRQRVPLRTALR